MESIELQLAELRTYFEETLRYFCRRKLEQNAATPYNIKDIIVVLSALPVELAMHLINDIDKDVSNLFSLEPSQPHQASDVAALFASLLGIVPGDGTNPGDLHSAQQGASANQQTGNRHGSNAIASMFSPFRLFGGKDSNAPSTHLLEAPTGQNPGMLKMQPPQGPMLRPEVMALPENSLIELLVKRLFPKRTEPILYAQYQGHRALEMTLTSISIRGLAPFAQSKLRVQDGRIDYRSIDPIVVVACEDVMVASRPLSDYHLRETIEEKLVIELTLPAARSDEIIEWADRVEIVISVFDYNESGVAPWAEWIGSARQRLSRFLDNALDGAPVPCHMILECACPMLPLDKRPFVEFSIGIPDSLVKLWHAYREKSVHPNAGVLTECIRSGLQDVPFDERNVADEDMGKVTNFDLYTYWKRRRANFKSKFPRRPAQCLARDEYGKVHLLPCFVQPLPGADVRSLEDAANIVAAIDTGLLPCCDTALSAFQMEMIQPIDLGLLSRQMSSLEASILLCGLFLSLDVDAREKRAVDRDRRNYHVRFWNPTTGRAFEIGELGAPRAVHGVFNHENFWFNVHRSASVERNTWGTIGKDPTKWEPFFESEIGRAMGPLQPVYSPPDFALNVAPASRNMKLETKILLSDLVDAISIYRQHELFLPDTLFDAHLSKTLQMELMEAIPADGTIISRADQVEAFLDSLDCRCGIPSAIKKNVRPGMIPRGRMYHFKTSVVQEIMNKLQEVGVLNHTFPGLRYIVAGVVQPMPWGLSSVYLYIGTVHEATLYFPRC
ncbi:Coiled-coil and C2 domain-containing protein 2A [Hondaea fermentalgiana]|uniref:Coiled-coil and C2 domain-containing protein 2A n=1 Tax=Hondaea fermentalgiana TaxID=2315210 RepID=A0A2R5GK11_9STRA|nr:Coiled-coil and C2 domain-containing protein 2A [Hondaea fermentalgiana]|eukprot:GBG31220.1 Coiled-coil and C2 domain-containing protein 2A [Hondaea fermentalgiana]